MKATVLREYDQSMDRDALVNCENVVDSKIEQLTDVIVRSMDGGACSTDLHVAEGIWCRRFFSQTHKHLIEMPPATRLASRRLNLESKALIEIVAPASHGLVPPGVFSRGVYHNHAALEEQFLDDTQVQLKTEVPARRATDDAARKKVAAINRFRFLHRAVLRDRPINLTTSFFSTVLISLEHRLRRRAAWFWPMLASIVPLLEVVRDANPSFRAEWSSSRNRRSPC